MDDCLSQLLSNASTRLQLGQLKHRGKLSRLGIALTTLCLQDEWSNHCATAPVLTNGLSFIAHLIACTCILFSAGDIISFIRGCTDGKIFSITDFPRTNFPADNQTTCAYRHNAGKVVVCLTVCKTDFCNGPRLDISDTSGVVSIQVSVNMIVVVLISSLHFYIKK